MDKILKRLFTLKNTKPIIDFLNSAYRDNIFYEAKLHYADREINNFDKKSSRYINFYADMYITVVDKENIYEYEIEFQTIYEDSMAIRMFRYGFTDIIKTDYGLEGKTEFKLFNKIIDVLMPENMDMQYANLCAESLNNLDEKIINRLCQYFIDYCDDFCSDVGEESYEFNILRDVLKYITPSCLIISSPKDKNKIVFHLEMNCDWEVEHGLEWTICDNNILYVGAFQSEDGWRDISYYKELNWNYVFNKTYCCLKNLPILKIIKERLISMAALDIIFSEEEWLRVYTWHPNWDEKSSLSVVDNGAGDTMHIAFSKDGCIIKGFDHESKLSPHAQEEFKVWKGIYEDVPEKLLRLLDDEAIEKEDVTFCIWQDSNHKQWKKGNIDIPEGYDDGCDYMLGRIFSVEDYIEWVKNYWGLEEELSSEDIEKIFKQQCITEEMIKKLNPDRDIKAAMEELVKIQYPVEDRFQLDS